MPERSFLKKPDKYISVEEAGRDEKDQPVHRTRETREPPSDDLLLRSVDPQGIFGLDRNRTALEEVDDAIVYSELRNPDEFRGAVTTRPSLEGYWIEEVRQSPRLYRVVWSASSARAGRFVNEYEFDEAASFNLVRAKCTRDGVLWNDYVLEFRNERGVHVPARIVRSYFDKKGPARKVELTLMESTLNEPLPAGQFDESALPKTEPTAVTQPTP